MDVGVAIKAIVLDANAFGGSVEPNVATIDNWASACAAHEAELWIPEIVAWELAQRVIDQVDSMARSITAHNAKRRRWGFSALPELSSVTEDDVIAQLERAGATVVPLTGDAAMAAIRDQVLLRGPGARKKDVKTGAADSGWIRSVIEYNDGDAESLIFVTGDQQAVEKTCTMLGIDLPRVAKHLGEIQHLLAESTPATLAQADEYKKIAQGYLGAPHIGGSDLIDILGLGRHEWWDVDLGLDYDDRWESQDRYVVPGDVEVIGEVEFDNWSGSLSAAVRVTVEVQEQYARQDQWGDLPEYRAFSYDAWVTGRLTIFTGSGDGVGTLEDYQLGADPDSVTSQPI